MTNIKFIEHHIRFVFTVDDQYYRITFERDEKDIPWRVQLFDVSHNETVYSKMLDAVVTPDIDLAEDIMRTYALRGYKLN